MQCFKCATPLPDGSRFCNSCGADVSGETAERTLVVESDPELQAKLQADLGTEFTIERELGRGGMAVVYLATDVHLGRKVAVKVLPPELTFSGGPQIIERFKREARTAATLDHPHVVPVHRVSISSKLSWYVMKYLEGETLADVIQREAPLPPERTGDIVGQIAQGLEYAHRRGVIHRDIKPANIAIDIEGWVTVTDFGIAKALDTSSLTGSGSMIGTPYYMSPEQCAGQKVSGASDQYSLAVVAYQMLSGHLPFTGQAVVDIIKKHCMDPPPPLAVLQPNLPPGLTVVVERGLAKSPSERFGSVKEFAAALSEAARLREQPKAAPRVVRPVTPRRVSETAVVRRAVAPVPQSEPAPEPKPLRSPYAKRSRLSIALGAVVTLALGGIIFWPPIRNALTGPSSAPGAEPRQPSTRAESPAEPRAARPDTQPSADTPATSPARLTAAPPGSVRPPRDLAVAPAPPTVERMGTVVLRGLRRGATIFLDGRRVSGPRIAVQPNSSHGVRVEAEGFGTWSDEVFVGAGQSVTRTVQMWPLTEAAGLSAPTAAAPTPASPTAGRTGTLVLRGVPEGATISLDGRRVTGPRIAVLPDLYHNVVVDAEGFTQWSAQSRISAGRTDTLDVRMRTLAEAEGLRAPTAAAPTPAAPAGIGYLSVGTSPMSRVFVNGRPATGNPLIRFEVPAGEVRLSFQVTDSVFGSWWADDTVVTVARQRLLNLRRISLKRRP